MAGSTDMVCYQDLIDAIKADIPFHFARYGDGEFYAIFKKKGCNTDKHRYAIPGLSEDMERTLIEKKPYLYGLQHLAANHPKLSPRIRELVGPGFPWINADIMHEASEKGKILSFFDLLRDRRILFIGPPHLKALKVNWDKCQLITIPEVNCYDTDRDTLASNIRDNPADMVVFCAGFLTNILIWNLHEDMVDRWMIDAGSLFDPYCGVLSRDYHALVKTSLYQ